MVRVELLYFEGCPNWQRTLATVERLIEELAVEAQLVTVRVEDAEDAERRRFLGSPSGQVEGRDVEPGADERGEFVFACRIYRSDGELSGEPDQRWLREALLAGTSSERETTTSTREKDAP